MPIGQVRCINLSAFSKTFLMSKLQLCCNNYMASKTELFGFLNGKKRSEIVFNFCLLWFWLQFCNSALFHGSHVLIVFGFAARSQPTIIQTAMGSRIGELCRFYTMSENVPIWFEGREKTSSTCCVFQSAFVNSHLKTAFTPGCVVKQASFNQNVSAKDFSAASSNTVGKVSVVAVVKSSSLWICSFAAQHKLNLVLLLCVLWRNGSVPP